MSDPSGGAPATLATASAIRRELGQLDLKMSYLQDRLSVMDADGLGNPAPGYPNPSQEMIAGVRKNIAELADRRTELHAQLDYLERGRFEQFFETSLPEERLFWLRRFHTSLGIGNAAAFAAVTSQVIKPEMATAAAAKTLAAAALWPMICFAGGLVTAGLLPLLLALGARRAWPLAITSSILFLFGVLAAIDGVMGVAGLVWPWEQGL